MIDHVEAETIDYELKEAPNPPPQPASVHNEYPASTSWAVFAPDDESHFVYPDLRFIGHFFASSADDAMRQSLPASETANGDRHPRLALRAEDIQMCTYQAKVPKPDPPPVTWHVGGYDRPYDKPF